MALVEWTEDYGQYKQGDQFAINNPDTLKYFQETGKIKVVDESYTNETVSEKVAEVKEEDVKPSKKASK
jgi:hypothetical protein